MCYVGRLKGSVPSKCEAGSQKCCKDLANTKLDLRNSLQIEGKGGATWGSNPLEGWRDMYIYIPVVPHKAVAEVSKIGNL